MGNFIELTCDMKGEIGGVHMKGKILVNTSTIARVTGCNTGCYILTTLVRGENTDFADALKVAESYDDVIKLLGVGNADKKSI